MRSILGYQIVDPSALHVVRGLNVGHCIRFATLNGTIGECLAHCRAATAMVVWFGVGRGETEEE
jgi:hypothetical protein